MAVDLSKLVSKRTITLDELNGKAIAIDAFNVLYQFLSIIRQPDGTPLMDKNGEVTSHLSGIFYRTIELVGKGISPIYVFDGVPSLMKKRTIEARMRRRQEANVAWKEAVEKGDLARAKSQAQASTRVNKEIVESSRVLLGLLGIPFINAPSEGEAQASYMCSKDMVYAAGSQDYDTLLFGSERVVRNLTFSGRRKLPMKNVYVKVETEMVNLKDTLSSLGINRDQLIWLGLMLGTDFNEGIDGIGPKTALKIVKECKDVDQMRRAVIEKSGGDFKEDILDVIDLFKNPEVNPVDLEEVKKSAEAKLDREGLVAFMCDRHGFDKERVEKFADILAKTRSANGQRGIDKWF
jgi:flap endonuclease-1